MHPAVSGGRPLIFAHRGGAGLAPENTIPAFDRSLALGADGLEFDVRLSRDGVVVVHHDALLDRTTDAFGPLAAKEAAELARVDASAGFVRAGHPWAGETAGVPTLSDVLRRFPGTRFIIELKGRSRELARAVVREVRAAGAEGRTCIGSFSWRTATEARRAEGGIATSASRLEVRAALYGSWIGLPVRAGRYVAFQVPELAGRIRIVSRRFVWRAHRMSLAVQVWTVDDPADVRRLLDWGVDAIITDRPDLAVPTLQDWVHQRPRRHGLLG